ncbi:hypothetical protein ACFV3R_22130 [Streptomyces sp. NPDC059740]|uniref:hypothetical protein n=1 Tax=Streptomyces sp. NPDC059740 TaxID=3346926 RepID=UPI00364C73CB
MAGFYRVELDALGRLVTQLGEAADGMRDAMRELKDIGPKGAGYADLEQACDDFQDKWGYGIKLIADATGGVAEGLSQTRKVYQQLEDQTSQMFQSGGQEVGK